MVGICAYDDCSQTFLVCFFCFNFHVLLCHNANQTKDTTLECVSLLIAPGDMSCIISSSD